MRVKPDLTFSKLDEETGGQLDKMFNKKDCMVEINPGRVVLPADYMTIGEDILNMEVLDTDVWMCSYPRTVELSSIMVDSHNEWHNESVKGTSVDLVKYRLARPRYIRSHLPWELLPVDIQREDGSAKTKLVWLLKNLVRPDGARQPSRISPSSLGYSRRRRRPFLTPHSSSWSVRVAAAAESRAPVRKGYEIARNMSN
ncbi:hypothetical protein MSG28_001991 [Choristoneura fumiferana]|uniref:Uncharacterized protein n=1 Tax=Choristoneura fumiferana TaxID=7141 RepID=A0ACC0JTR8_CHOFU|nr:hypothetical protein MSG28_001991 [Choristoneura fumiferana]